MFGLKKKGWPSISERIGRMFVRTGVIERRIKVLESEASWIREQLHKHELAAGGGFWKTVGGHILRIRDMSTDHIKRCIAGNFAKPNSLARANMEVELRRRREAYQWEDSPLPGVVNVRDPNEPTDDPRLFAQGLRCVGRLFGANIHIDFNTPDHQKRAITEFFNQRNSVYQARRGR